MLCIRKIIKGFQSVSPIDTSFFENTPDYDYLIDGSSFCSKKVLEEEDFIAEIYQLMAGWTYEDLDKITGLIKGLLVAKEAEVHETYKSIHEVPIIPNFNTDLGPFEWIKAFFNFCKDFKSKELDASGLLAIYDSLNITKILKEGNGPNEIETIFTSFSKRIVAEYGIASYDALLQYILKRTQKKSLQSDENLVLTFRHEVLAKIFSSLKVDRTVSEGLFKLIIGAIKSIKTLSLEALKLLSNWIKENEINDYTFTNTDVVKIIAYILEDLDDDHFNSFCDQLKAQISDFFMKHTNLSTERSVLEENCITEILALKSNINLIVANACQIVLDSISKALEGIYLNHKCYGTISLNEISSMINDSAEIVEKDFLRTVAVSKELDQALLGSCSNNESIDVEVFQSKSIILLTSHETDHKSSQNILLRPSEGKSFSEISFLGVPIFSNTQDSIGALNLKLEGASQKLNELDSAFIKKASKCMFDVINEIDYRSKLINVLISACSYEKIHADTDLEAYIVSNQLKETPIFFLLTENLSEIESSQTCSFMIKNAATLTELNSEDNRIEHLKSCYIEERDIIMDDFSYIPISGPKKDIIGILRLKFKESKSQDHHHLIDEGIFLSKYLGAVLSKISEEIITFKSVINRELGIFSWI